MGYDALLVLPGVGFMLFSFTSAVWLFHIADRKRYVIVEGICAEVTKSILFKRVKTVTLEADGKILRIQLKQHRRGYRAGAKLRLYIQESAKVYERDGALLIYDYILIEQRMQKSRVKAEKTKIFFQKASSGFGDVSFKERSGRFKA